MTKKNYTPIATFGSLLFIAFSLSLIILLSKLTSENNLVVADYQDTAEAEHLLKAEDLAAETEPLIQEEEEVSLKEALGQYSAQDESIQALITDINSENYAQDLIGSQDEIASAIFANNLDEEELGYLFLPEFPAEESSLANVNQINAPLYLQKDAEWRTAKYGNGSQQLGENGCAILSLAMVHAFYQNRHVDPMEILDWSQERYWVDDAGTSWNIFHEFAEAYNYDFHNYGANFYDAMNAVNEGKLIVASVEPGFFTEEGHIIVIRGYADGKVYVNDPNDDPMKMYSIQGIDEEVLLSEGLNYWSLSL